MYILLSFQTKSNTVLELNIACLFSNNNNNNNNLILLKRMVDASELGFMDALGQGHHED